MVSRSAMSELDDELQFSRVLWETCKPPPVAHMYSLCEEGTCYSPTERGCPFRGTVDDTEPSFLMSSASVVAVRTRPKCVLPVPPAAEGFARGRRILQSAYRHASRTVAVRLEHAVWEDVDADQTCNAKMTTSNKQLYSFGADTCHVLSRTI